MESDIKELKIIDKEIKEENREIKEKFIKPIERWEKIRYIQFTSIWWIVGMLIAIIASWFTFWITKAFWK